MLQRLEQQPATISELARPVAPKLPGLMRHLDVLSDAGLITRTKTGRAVSVQLPPRPLQEGVAWLQRYDPFWAISLDRIAAMVEDTERPL